MKASLFPSFAAPVVKWRRLLLCVLLAMSFDTVVPVERAVRTPRLDADLEEAMQFRSQRDHSRRTHAEARARSGQVRLARPLPITIPSPRAAAVRWEILARPLRVEGDQGLDPPGRDEDH